MKHRLLRLNAISVAKLMRHLQDCPCTVGELVEAVGLNHATTSGYVKALHREGVVRVAGWEPDAAGRVTVPAYILGKGADARKPLVPREESNRRYRAKQEQMAIQNAIAGVA